MTTDDPVVTEIRMFRESRAVQFNLDVLAIVRDAQQRDASGDRHVVRLPPRIAHASKVRERKPPYSP